MRRTIHTSAGRLTITGLKRRQIKELLAQGVDLYKGSDDPESYLNAILALAVAPEDQDKLDDLYVFELQELLRKIMDLTFMTGEQRKNYAWQWDSTMPGNSIPAPTAEPTDCSAAGDVQN